MTSLKERLLASSPIHNSNVDRDPSTFFSHQTTDKKYKLMLKTHYETGVHYLCITKKTDFRKYPGSGTGWKALLAKHPGPVFTCLLFSTDSKDELAEAGLHYSDFFDVVDNPDFANRIPESGYVIDPDLYALIASRQSPEWLSERGRRGGNRTKEKKSGIFREDLQHLRSEWNRNAALCLNEKGTRGGCCTPEYSKNNPEKHKEQSSRAGKIGGKITGNMLWWNDGTINTKSNNCPGEGWVRGMLMSDKKREQCAKFGQRKPSLGKWWVTDGSESKQLPRAAAEELIRDGWRRGRTLTKKGKK